MITVLLIPAEQLRTAIDLLQAKTLHKYFRLKTEASRLIDSISHKAEETLVLSLICLYASANIKETLIFWQQIQARKGLLIRKDSLLTVLLWITRLEMPGKLSSLIKQDATQTAHLSLLLAWMLRAKLLRLLTRHLPRPIKPRAFSKRLARSARQQLTYKPDFNNR